MCGRKSGSGVNLQGALKQNGINQTGAKYDLGVL